MEKKGNYILGASVQEDSINNARAMMGWDEPSVVIEPPRRQVERRGRKMVEVEYPAWVKFSTDFKAELADLNEYSLKVFIYIGLSVNFTTGEAYPGLRKIAADTKMDKDTVAKAVADLEEKGFLSVQKREGNSNIYKPVRFIAIGKGVRPEGTPTAEPSDENDEPSDENAKLSLDSRVNRAQQEVKQESTRPLGVLSKKDIQQANAQVDAMIANSKKARYQNRDKIPEPYLLFADLYNELTKQEPTKRVIFDWLGAFEDWKQEGLQPEHIRAAWNYANRPEGGFPVGRPGSLTNTAVAMKSKSLASQSKPAIDETTVKNTMKELEDKWNFTPAPPPAQRPRIGKQA